MKMVLASHNAGKLKEMQLWLAPLGIELVLQSELGIDIDVEETGETFEANSLLKAEAVAHAAHMPAIADDSGMCVDALHGAPGVTTARYGGQGPSDRERYELLLMHMKDKTDRSAKFVSVVTCVFPNGDVVQTRGELPGSISITPAGEGGFGYDPIFYVNHMGMTLAEMTMEERQSCSHRAAAIRALAVKLEEYNAEKKKEGIEWN